MKLLRLAVLIPLVLFWTGVSYGQIEELAEQREKQANLKTEGDKDKEKDVTFALHGYAQANFVVSRNDMGVKGNKWINSKYEFPRIGATLQLELEGNAYDIAHFFSAVQIEYNAAGEKTNFPNFYLPNAMLQYTYFTYNADFKRDEISKAPFVNVRETYVDLYGKGVTFRAGQQIISWGEIEGIEAPSDVVIPWDFTTMSNYFEYSRIGVPAANLSFHFAKQQLQFIWIPIFQPAKLPEESLYKRGVTSIKRPAFEVRNGEYAARLSGAIGNQFRYGLGFLYGYDDMPDAKIKMLGTFQVISAGGLSIPVYLPQIAITQMSYNRVYVPTFDLGVGLGEVMSWKVSANANFTQDFYGKKDLIKNPTVTYLTGIESSNIFLKFYLGLYAGQQWVINYTKPANDFDPAQLLVRLDKMQLPNNSMIKGYGQQYPFKWMLTSNIQRNFLENDALEFQVRLALYADPKLVKWDYVIYPYFMYKFTNGVSTALGFVFAKRLGDNRNMIISETRYSF
jgi:hypothetical protein